MDMRTQKILANVETDLECLNPKWLSYSQRCDLLEKIRFFVDLVREQEEVREPVRWFATEMEKTLKANDRKGGWLECDAWWLLGHMRKEVIELERAMISGRDANSVEHLIREATDVANFAMMIADIARQTMKVTL